MKKTCKRITSIFLTVMLVCLCLFPQQATAKNTNNGWVGAWSTSPVEFYL